MKGLNDMELKNQLLLIAGLVGAYGGYIVLKYVILFIIGVVAQLGEGGTISVSATIQAIINGSSAGVATAFTYIDAAVLLVLSLVSIVVIIAIFWGFIKGYMDSGSKGKGGNSNY